MSKYIFNIEERFFIKDLCQGQIKAIALSVGITPKSVYEYLNGKSDNTKFDVRKNCMNSLYQKTQT